VDNLLLKTKTVKRKQQKKAPDFQGLFLFSFLAIYYFSFLLFAHNSIFFCYSFVTRFSTIIVIFVLGNKLKT